MKKFAVGAATMCAAAFVALSSAPAQALSLPHEQPMPIEPGIGASAGGLVILQVERSGGVKENQLLRCPGGTGHAKGEEACAQLTTAGGTIETLSVADGMCTKEYDPVTLRAFGFWDGRFVAYEREFANHCTGINETGGAVFAFDQP
ncbi:MAG TPA: SSI family serine proteinase inhibitor [Glycomyces sp.]|nr:SSI family serine proteinase inhibitor [Glycomyces sp.]